MKPRESYSYGADGAVHVTHTVDAEPIMDAMKMYSDVIGGAAGKASQKLVGAIDPNTAANWQKEWGAKIGTKEFAKLAVKRLSNDIDYRKFRAGH